MSKRRNLGADHCADDDSSSIETKIEDEDALSGKNNDTSDKVGFLREFEAFLFFAYFLGGLVLFVPVRPLISVDGVLI